MADSFVSAFDVGLFDLDGVCYLGPEAVPHAPESISAAADAGVHIAYVTNNASRTPQAMSEQLRSLGIPASAEAVISSSRVGAQILAQHCPAGAKVLVLGTEALRIDVRGQGFKVVDSADDEPAAVIQGFTPEMSWALMSEAALAIRQGALYVATNLDKTIPRDRGLMIGNGSIAKAIENSTGVVPLSAGKPEPEIFLQAARLTHAERPFAVGDNLDTDIQGAVSAGIAALHVLTGLATARDVCIAVPGQRPDFLADDLRCMLEPYPAVTQSENGVTCGQYAVSWNGAQFVLVDHSGMTSTLVTDEAEIGLDLYRALAHAAWRAVDEGVERSLIEGAIGEFKVVRN